jgi:hypothetical protein
VPVAEPQGRGGRLGQLDWPRRSALEGVDCVLLIPCHLTSTFTSFEILAPLLCRLESSWVIADVSHSVDTTVLLSTSVQHSRKAANVFNETSTKRHRERTTGAPLVHILDGTSAVSKEGDTSAVAKEGLFNERPLSVRE